jgi:hypothetical protein
VFSVAAVVTSYTLLLAVMPLTLAIAAGVMLAVAVAVLVVRR